MVAALALIVGRNRWQPAQLDLSTQGINDPKHGFKLQGGLACFKVDDESHTNPCREGQLGLRKPELLPSGTKCIAELSR
jgi:hypothetical protein